MAGAVALLLKEKVERRNGEDMTKGEGMKRKNISMSQTPFIPEETNTTKQRNKQLQMESPDS